MEEIYKILKERRKSLRKRCCTGNHNLKREDGVFVTNKKIEELFSAINGIDVLYKISPSKVRKNINEVKIKMIKKLILIFFSEKMKE